MSGIEVPSSFNTPYCNTISPADQPPYPGDLELERRINALAALSQLVRFGVPIGGLRWRNSFLMNVGRCGGLCSV